MLMRKLLPAMLLLTSVAPLSIAQAQGDSLKPYVLAYSHQAEMTAEVEAVKSKLQAAGFRIIGEFAPYPDGYVVAVTNPDLLKAAGSSKRGGFAAAEHVGLTRVGDQIQVSYLNPAYIAPAYRLSADLSPVGAALKSALGAEQTFGADKGRSADQLRSYNYMVGMERFDDHYELGHHASHEKAVQTVEANLKARVGGAAQVYRIDIPGTQQTLFGVSRAAVSSKDANDKHIMADTVDPMFPLKTTAYLPYQMLVDGNEVIALHMRFRMAVWHPDLTMMTFGKLVSSPGEVGKLLESIAAGQKQASPF